MQVPAAIHKNADAIAMVNFVVLDDAKQFEHSIPKTEQTKAQNPSKIEKQENKRPI